MEKLYYILIQHLCCLLLTYKKATLMQESSLTLNYVFRQVAFDDNTFIVLETQYCDASMHISKYTNKFTYYNRITVNKWRIYYTCIAKNREALIPNWPGVLSRRASFKHLRHGTSLLST